MGAFDKGMFSPGGYFSGGYVQANRDQQNTQFKRNDAIKATPENIIMEAGYGSILKGLKPKYISKLGKQWFGKNGTVNKFFGNISGKNLKKVNKRWSKNSDKFTNVNKTRKSEIFKQNDVLLKDEPIAVKSIRGKYIDKLSDMTNKSSSITNKSAKAAKLVKDATKKAQIYTAAGLAVPAVGLGGTIISNEFSGDSNVTPQSVQDVTLSTDTNTTVKPTVKPTITEVAKNRIKQEKQKIVQKSVKKGDNSFMDIESSSDYKDRIMNNTTGKSTKKSSPKKTKAPASVVSKPKVRKTKKTVTKKAPVVKAPVSKGRQASKNPFSKDFSWGALGLDNAAVRKIDSKNGINTDYHESGPEPDLIGEHKAIIAAAKKRKSSTRQKKLTAEANKIMDLF